MAYCPVEHAIRLMNFGRCKIDSHIFLQFLHAKALNRSCSFNHLDSPVCKWEQALFPGILLLRQSELLNRCGVDEHCAGVKRVDLHGDFFSIQLEPAGDNDGRSLLSEGWSGDGSAETRTRGVALHQLG